jgi:HlyD family secretion protein
MSDQKLTGLRRVRYKPLFALAAAGILTGLIASHEMGKRKPAEAPVFNPAPNPYPAGIYANGIIESYLTNGENINMYPEVGATVREILVKEGDAVKAGTPLVRLDDTIQRATVMQLAAQADAALGALEELKAQPRKEVLDVSVAQVVSARASLKNVRDQLVKIEKSYRINPRSVAKTDLDNARNAVVVAQKSLEVAEKQYELTRAGAWSYDIANQERTVESLTQQFEAANALLSKYTLRAPSDGVVMAIRTAVGSYVSPSGVYGTYTQGYDPVIVMGGSEESLQVRTYVDEILIARLPEPERMTGTMFIRGTNVSAGLQFVRVQPYVTPKIQLSDERQERVDVRVLPIVFKFEKPPGVHLYPGELVDVYLAENTQLPGKAQPSPSPVSRVHR